MKAYVESKFYEFHEYLLNFYILIDLESPIESLITISVIVIYICECLHVEILRVVISDTMQFHRIVKQSHVSSDQYVKKKILKSLWKKRNVEFSFDHPSAYSQNIYTYWE